MTEEKITVQVEPDKAKQARAKGNKGQARVLSFLNRHAQQLISERRFETWQWVARREGF